MGRKKCPFCDGSGSSVEEDKNGEREVCVECDGTGRVSSGKKRGEI